MKCYENIYIIWQSDQAKLKCKLKCIQCTAYNNTVFRKQFLSLKKKKKNFFQALQYKRLENIIFNVQNVLSLVLSYTMRIEGEKRTCPRKPKCNKLMFPNAKHHLINYSNIEKSNKSFDVPFNWTKFFFRLFFHKNQQKKKSIQVCKQSIGIIFEFYD